MLVGAGKSNRMACHAQDIKWIIPQKDIEKTILLNVIRMIFGTGL
jgi:hypothetical protein